MAQKRGQYFRKKANKNHCHVGQNRLYNTWCVSSFKKKQKTSDTPPKLKHLSRACMNFASYLTQRLTKCIRSLVQLTYVFSTLSPLFWSKTKCSVLHYRPAHKKRKSGSGVSASCLAKQGYTLFQQCHSGCGPLPGF